MKQIFVVEVNVPYDQYGLESDDLLETLQLSHNPEVKFRVAEITERVDIARIESMLRD